MRVGLVADTHGYLGADVVEALRGCDIIMHAGDVGDGVLEPLLAVAPLVAVRGNNDARGEASLLPEIAYEVVEGWQFVVVHRLADAPGPGDWDVLVFGHCHRRHADREGTRLLVNPGAAGRRGFHAERSVAVALVTAQGVDVEFVDLGPRSLAGR